MMNERGKSDSSEVPAKSPNNIEELAVEATEGRELAKGNSPKRNALRTQGRDSTFSALERVGQAARKDKKQRFTALLHHIYDVERLRAAYLATKKDAAAGVDGETWEHYGENLEANLQGNHPDLAPGAALYSPLVSVGSGLSSLSSRALGRPYPRREPDAVTPLVRIYGGVMSDHGPYSDFVDRNQGGLTEFGSPSVRPGQSIASGARRLLFQWTVEDHAGAWWDRQSGDSGRRDGGMPRRRAWRTAWATVPATIAGTKT